MALGSCGHRITHQLRPINVNGRSILAVTSSLVFRAFPGIRSTYRKSRGPIDACSEPPHADPSDVRQATEATGPGWPAAGGQLGPGEETLRPAVLPPATTVAHCTQPSCSCHHGGPLHPAHHLTFTERGKTRTVYVPQDLLTEVQLWVQEYQRLKVLIHEIS